jgi:hypothetical protein
MQRGRQRQFVVSIGFSDAAPRTSASRPWESLCSVGGVLTKRCLAPGRVRPAMGEPASRVRTDSEGDPHSSDQKGQDTRMGVLRQSGPSLDGWLSRGSRSDLGSGVPNLASSPCRQAADAVSSDGVISQCDHGCVKTSKWKTLPENVTGFKRLVG